MESERVTRALERLSEDSSLTEDLTDSAATRALAWAESNIKAADAAPDDAAFSAQVQAVRAALRSAAKQASTGDEVVAMAEQQLAGEPPAATGPAATATATASVGGDPTALLGAAPTPTVSTPSVDPAALLDNAPAAAVTTPAAETLRAAATAAEDAPRAQRRSWRRRLRNWIHRKG